MGSSLGEDLAIAGVVLIQNHLETALDTIHSAHSFGHVNVKTMSNTRLHESVLLSHMMMYHLLIRKIPLFCHGSHTIRLC